MERDNWSAKVEGNYFYVSNKKVERVKKALSVWSKEIFGVIFKELAIGEEIVKLKEQLFDDHPTF